MSRSEVKLIVIGASWGGFDALKIALSPLPESYPVPILVVYHQHHQASDYVVKAFDEACHLKVQFAQQQQRPEAGNVYLAPPDHHLILNQRGEIRLTQDEKHKFSRPAIDPLFHSAASLYGAGVVAVILTGASDDGCDGALSIKQQGGRVYVQHPDSAEAKLLPESVIQSGAYDGMIWLDQVGPLLWDLYHQQ